MRALFALVAVVVLLAYFAGPTPATEPSEPQQAEASAAFNIAYAGLLEARTPPPPPVQQKQTAAPGTTQKSSTPTVSKTRTAQPIAKTSSSGYRQVCGPNGCRYVPTYGRRFFRRR